MAKNYKITYKTFWNARLKEVSYAGISTHPLYIQITHERKVLVFKSHYFDLFIKPRHPDYPNKISTPPLKHVIKLETTLIKFVLDRLKNGFSLVKFKEAYTFYSTDLCQEAEAGFIDFLHTFFKKEGMPHLASFVKESTKHQLLYDLILDMKIAFKEPLYKKLLEKASLNSPPYLPLYAFMLKIKKQPMLYLSIMEWESQSIREQFSDFMNSNYSKNASNEVSKKVEDLITRIQVRPT